MIGLEMHRQDSHHQADLGQQQQQPIVNQQQQALLAMYPQQQQQLLVNVSPAANATNQQSGSELIGLYYFGSISRETAEWILKTHGNKMDGAYLLRSSGPNDDFVLSLMVNHHQQQNMTNQQQMQIVNSNTGTTTGNNNLEVLHYKIVETEDSFVALHGQVGDEKFATIDELIEKAQGVATKPRWPISRLSLDSQILPPTYWGLTVDQVRLAILIKAKQWGFPLLSTLFQQTAAAQQDQAGNFNNNSVVLGTGVDQQQVNPSDQAISNNNVTTLNNETIRTLIYKSLHEFQPWFHGKISRDEAERRIRDGPPRDGRFLVRERDNYSYAMCISHKKSTKHYRIDVLPTGELAIQDGHKFTSLMALVSHYTIMSDGLWCALTEACARPVVPIVNSRGNNLAMKQQGITTPASQFAFPLPTSYNALMNQNLYCVPPSASLNNASLHNMMLPVPISNNNNLLPNENNNNTQQNAAAANQTTELSSSSNGKCQSSLICAHQGSVNAIKVPIKEWLQNINHKWSQLMASKNQHQSLNSFLFGSQNPLNNHCRHNHHRHNHSHHHHRHNHQHSTSQRRKSCKNDHTNCACMQQTSANQTPVINYSQKSNQYNQNSSKFKEISINSHTLDKCQDSTTTTASLTRVSNCCSNNTNICPTTTTRDCANGFVQPRNFFHQTTGNNEQNNINSNSILSCLPQNSGFTLNSQSFIGSPLFAVKPATQNHDHLSRSLKSDQQILNTPTNGKPNVEEEKLISPAQSISANLNNNPYHLNADIYGSQTSTVVVNDQIPTTSSSSSSSTNFMHKNFSNPPPNLPQMNYGHTNNIRQIKVNGGGEFGYTTNSTDLNANQVQSSVVLASGPILCGQHAGPAYRYTNCQDESSFKPCYHRPHQLLNRAADDSQLTTPSTQLVGPAAMAKFVQFQDGQCLRTHRDTRSIQMAYLSSRQLPQPGNSYLPQTNNNTQVPNRDLNAGINSKFCCPGNNTTKLNNNNIGGQVNSTNNISLVNNSNWRPSQVQYNSNNNNNNNNLNQCSFTSVGNPHDGGGNSNEIDLMDCGGGGGFEFKYDPKLIKSSSIETLCGVETAEAETSDDLSNFKTNSELVMSLQSYWQASQQQPSILNPTTLEYNNHSDDHEDINDCLLQENETLDQTREMLSSLMVATGEEESRLDHHHNMKKKHDLDELTTALLAELTASLKAQVDLKNKRSGFGLHNTEKSDNNNNSNNNHHHHHQAQHESNQDSGIEQAHAQAEANPLELINEFDTLLSNNI